MRTPPIVLVEWEDAWSDKTTIHGDNPYYRRGYPVMAAGFLQYEEDQVVVCRAWAPPRDADEPEHFSDCVSIPRSLVKRVRQVRAWQDHQLPTTPTEKPVRRRRRKKAAPTPASAEVPAPEPAEEEPHE